MDEEGKGAGQKINKGYQHKSSNDLDYRDLKNVRDDVIWRQFEVVAGAPREAKRLAKNPRFRWQLRKDQVHQCQLCNVLWDKAEAAGEVSTSNDSSNLEFLNILLMGGPVFEDGGNHQCIHVSSWSSQILCNYL
jgi:hypothetical protein